MKEWKKPEVKKLGIYETEDGEMACASTGEIKPLYDIPSQIWCPFRENGSCTHKHHGESGFWLNKFVYINNATWPCPKAGQGSVTHS